MTHTGPLHWRTGDGWLVLIGGASDRWRSTEAIDRAAVEAMSDESPIAFVPAAGCPPDYGPSFLAQYLRLGAPPGYVVPIHDKPSARDPANTRRLAEAGLIYLGGGDTRRLVETLAGTPALDAMAAAFAAGAVIVGISAGAIALAAWGVSADPGVGVVPGWGWLPQAIAAPHYDALQADALHAALKDRPDMLGLGLPEDAALALGPAGQVATWGGSQITVTLGSQFGQGR